MIIVTPCLGYQLELAASRVSIFSAELVGLQVEFSNRIEDHGRIRACHAQVIVINSVDRKVVVPRTRSTDCAADARGPARLRNSIWSEDRQVQSTVQRSANDRDVQHVFGIEIIVERGGSGLHLRDSGRYFHRFRSGADIQPRIRDILLVGEYCYTLLDVFLESPRFHYDGIGSGQNTRKIIGSG